MNSKKVLVITDVCDEDFSKMIKEKYENCTFVSPDKPIKPCVGCLGCWLKTPGKCVLNDSYCHMGKEISKCDKMIFISKCCYGGFSPFVKNVIDRSISYMLPLFKKKGRHSCHHRRYGNKFDCSAYFYSQNISDGEKNTALELCKANAALWDCKSFNVVFLENAEDIVGCI